MNKQFDRNHPFLASIKERELLSKPGSLKSTFHVVLDLKGSEITYQVGDSIAIYPENSLELVETTLKALGSSGNENVIDKMGVTYTLRHFFTKKANLVEVNRKLFQEIVDRQPNLEKKTHLLTLQKDELKKYLADRYVWDFLEENREVSFTSQEFISLLMPLLPRFYSIASSQQVVGDEVHLTVAGVKYVSNGHERNGVCSYYLSDIAQYDVPIYVQSHNGFTLPQQEHTPIIMVGPGTGVAPFRAFMQERFLKNSKHNWLFFGERKRATDFLYEDFWSHLHSQGALQLDLAFSRDQEHKIYVQHRMEEKSAKLYEWLQNGAHFYVCGDAKQMARDVEETLLQIIQKHGNKDEKGAKEYLKTLRQEKRYLKDVY